MFCEGNSEFYPPILFQYSPVYHTWVKLFVKDVYTLKVVEGFEDSPALFWLNHPIRWVHLFGVVVGLEKREKGDFVSLDDSSGRIIELILKERHHRHLIPAFPEENGLLDIGMRIKVRGTLSRLHGSRRISVIKLDVIHDPNIEILGWEERIRLKQEVLSKVWIIDSDLKTATIKAYLKMYNRSITQGVSKYSDYSFKILKSGEHTMQNLKRLVLNQLKENEYREFTISILRTDTEIEFAANCLATKIRIEMGELENTIVWSQSTEVCRLLMNCISELVNQGLIICVNGNQGVYVTIGEWNLSRTIRKCCRESLHKWRLAKHSSDNEKAIITTREVWQKVRRIGDEWKAVDKRLVTNIMAKVMPTLSGWRLLGKGKWILDK
ncbi:hypothetical protein PNEG_01718 [Pneumocystis murina B123]|uniref:CST complex subunit Stn1 N-terminal domain-containing protein n=1 Tax=Pneumocystis murina (strain B123) TaxID=1069680 RepID=M7P7W2_PNEMU|nr:hypothetical protein PNEG_01718 [Pneumocystis murina B123]EMR09960.1 hypothetical protein PNEG_01718 [Pneumocystis murina B123]